LLTALATLLLSGVGFAGEVVWCHKVRTGDTLTGIARRYRVPLARLLKVNRRGVGPPLRVGVKLALPSVAGLPEATLPLWQRALRARAGHLRLENRAATRDALSRLESAQMVRRFRTAGLLVPLPATTKTYYVASVPPSLRLARPWTKRFIEQLAGALHGLFGIRLRITSLTRTPRLQLALRRTNANAAPARGALLSTHLTGAAVDISKRPLSPEQTVWLRTVLHRLTSKGLVRAIEEFREPHFHVLVRKRYAPYAATLTSPLLIGGC
jgi:LysM repeat protein